MKARDSKEQMMLAMVSGRVKAFAVRLRAVQTLRPYGKGVQQKTRRLSYAQWLRWSSGLNHRAMGGEINAAVFGPTLTAFGGAQ